MCRVQSHIVQNPFMVQVSLMYLLFLVHSLTFLSNNFPYTCVAEENIVYQKVGTFKPTCAIDGFLTM